MGEIPMDIENTATALCDEHPIWPTHQIVMKAIAQERRRCADVAQKEGEGYRDNGLPLAAIGALQVRRAILNP